MKHLLTLVLISISAATFAQTLQARVDTKGKRIDGLCDQPEFFSLLNGMGDQQEAIPPISEELLYSKLLSLAFIQEHPDFKGKDVVAVDVNCNGQVVYVECMFKDAALNEQIKSVFMTMGNFTPGKMLGKNVDCEVLYSIELKKGKLILNNHRR